MSKYRPTLHDCDPKTPVMRNGTAYLLILKAVERQPGLIHGKLQTPNGEYCAIGSYFHDQPSTGLPNALIDEVAAVNDSMPTATRQQRKALVTKWLRWKLRQLHFPLVGRPQKSTPVKP